MSQESEWMTWIYNISLMLGQTLWNTEGEKWSEKGIADDSMRGYEESDEFSRAR
jgi:hypothetical protein